MTGNIHTRWIGTAASEIEFAIDKLEQGMSEDDFCLEPGESTRGLVSPYAFLDLLIDRGWTIEPPA